MAQTAADVLIDTIHDWGVDTIFGLPGDGINGFMEALRKRQDEVRFVHTRHEETAALAVCSQGEYGIPAGLQFGYPIRTDGTNWQIIAGLPLDDFAKSKIKITTDELVAEREDVKGLIS